MVTSGPCLVDVEPEQVVVRGTLEGREVGRLREGKEVIDSRTKDKGYGRKKELNEEVKPQTL